MAGTATAHASQVLGNDLPYTGSVRSTYSCADSTRSSASKVGGRAVVFRRFRPQPIHTSRAAIIMFENFASLIVTILAVTVIVILNSSLLLLFSERGSHFEV